jgi:hypothetical protein
VKLLVLQKTQQTVAKAAKNPDKKKKISTRNRDAKIFSKRYFRHWHIQREKQAYKEIFNISRSLDKEAQSII